MKWRMRCFLMGIVGLFALTFVLPGAAIGMKINIASTFGPDAPVHFGLEKFKELLSQRSKGDMQVQIHVGGSMGGERDIFEAMSSGGLEMGAIGAGDTAIFFPKYYVFEVPYVLRDVDHFWKYWNGPLGEQVNNLSLKERGVMTAGVVYRGARYLTANKPIRAATDVKGLKLRLPEIKTSLAVWQTLGALPVVVAFPEVYMALKTGVAEAQENPKESIWGYKFYEVQKYLIATKHVHAACKYQISKKWFDTLNANQQKLILDTWKDAAAYANQLAVQFDEKLNGDLQAKGMTLINPDISSFQKAVQPALQELNKSFWVPGLLEKVLAIK